MKLINGVCVCVGGGGGGRGGATELVSPVIVTSLIDGMMRATNSQVRHLKRDETYVFCTILLSVTMERKENVKLLSCFSCRHSSNQTFGMAFYSLSTKTCH